MANRRVLPNTFQHSELHSSTGNYKRPLVEGVLKEIDFLTVYSETGMWLGD
jgi:hypothetical protein